MQFREVTFNPLTSLPLFLPCQFLGHETCCVFLQGGCGEGCSHGLPGVPGMAGAKGESGDTGKPGVTPLDSCDMVRPSGTGRNIFSIPFMILPNQNHGILTYGAATVLRPMQNGTFSFCMVFVFAWLDWRSCRSDVAPWQRWILTPFLFSVFQCLEKLQATQPAVSSRQR